MGGRPIQFGTRQILWSIAYLSIGLGTAVLGVRLIVAGRGYRFFESLVLLLGIAFIGGAVGHLFGRFRLGASLGVGLFLIVCWSLLWIVER
jgi:hypothetical protein